MPSSSDDLLRIIDAPYEVAELGKVQAKLMEMLEVTKSFSGVSLFSKTTNGTSDFKAQETAITGGLERIAALEKELETIRSRNSSSHKVRTEEEIRATENLRAVNKSKVDDIRAEGNAYKQLSLEYNRAAAELKSLIVQYGESDKRVVSMTERVTQMSERLKSADAVVGQHTRKVGDYGTAWEKVGFSFKGLGPFFASIKESFKGIGEAAAGMIGGIVLVEKSFEFIKDSVKEFMAAEDSTARLNNILHNLGREDVLAELNKEAKELSETLGTVSEKDVKETFAKLATYGKLSKNQVLELTPVIADLAAMMRVSMPEAADVLAKSLEGRTNPALKAMGINLKEGKDAQERFGIIMDQLAPRISGFAKRFGDELAGSVKKSEIAIEELKVQVGSEFAPAINRAETAILEGAKGIPQMFESINAGFQNIMEKGKLAFLALVKVATFGRSTGLDDYLKDKSAQAKILEDSKQLQQAKEEAESFRKQASERTLDAQAHELNVQKQLLIGDLARYKLEAAKGKVSAETTYELQKQNEIVKALVGQYNSSRDTRTLGFGGSDSVKEKKAKKEKEDKYPKAKFDTLGTSYAAMELGESDASADFEAGHGAFVDKIGGQINATAKNNDLEKQRQAELDKENKEYADKKKERAFAEIDMGREVADATAAIMRARYEKELNMIQKVIDKNNQLKEVETRNIANSTLSQQEKANALIILDAKVAANNEALHRKQRDIKIKEAKFDRDKAVFDIVANTAVGVAKAIPNVFLEVAADVAGAAALATVIAKPIPTYAVGTDNHPGGPMIVGEKGPELMLTPGGGISMTPGIPTLTFGEKGTKIIPADEVNRMMLGDMMKQTAFHIDNKKELNEIRDAINEGTMAQLAAMKKKSPIHNHIHIHSAFESHINNSVRN